MLQMSRHVRENGFNSRVAEDHLKILNNEMEVFNCSIEAKVKGSALS
jgi:hypothetical protein